MAVKTICVLFGCAFFESALTQCLGRDPLLAAGLGSPFGWSHDAHGPLDTLGYGSPCPAANYGLAAFVSPSGLAASYGGGLTITSSSPIAPTGLSVTSENAIEGTVTMAGQLPFLGTVTTDGSFATVGAGAVTYGCGDGAIGIVAEAPISLNPGSNLGYGPGIGYGMPGRVGCSIY